jgi:hypothetical protein
MQLLIGALELHVLVSLLEKKPLKLERSLIKGLLRIGTLHLSVGIVVMNEVEAFLELIQNLRSEDGCPWDKE